MISHSDITIVFLALGIMLGAARLLGEVVRRLGQPAVLGEILAGCLLGPTLFGRLAPDWFSAVFPREGAAAVLIEGIATISVALFLLVAGLEVDLSRVWRQGRVAIWVSLTGTLVPLALGFSLAWIFPQALGREGSGSPLVFALFFATALSISALPVIARTLLDLNLFRTDIGMIVIAAAIANDVIGWNVFAIVLGLMGSAEGGANQIGLTIGLTLAFVVTMLSVVRLGLNRVLPWVHAHGSWPGGVLGFVLCLTLLAAAFTEWIGIHAIFGAFIAGVALGDSRHLRKHTRATLDQFISSFFAPLFFASVGLSVDFIAKFDLPLVLIVTLLACVGKIAGCGLGARAAGMSWRESWAIGAGMNARGAMEIVLGLLALQAGVIRERLFVALVVMALVTSVISGPLIQRILGQRRKYRLKAFIQPRSVVPELHAQNRREAIAELAGVLAPLTKIEADALAAAVLEREDLLPSGLAGGVAVPNARIPGLSQPAVALGLARHGIDFDAPDGERAHVIIMVLAPSDHADVHWGLLEDISHNLESRETRERLLGATTFTEILAALNWGEHHGEPAAEGPRSGAVLVGAGPLARHIARALRELGVGVTLVDTNREHCRQAEAEGLTIVHGNGLRDVILFHAGAHQARMLIAMTANAEVNAKIAALARHEFGISEIRAVGTDTGPLLDLDSWNRAIEEGAVEWVDLPILEGEAPGQVLERAVLGAPGALPALVVRTDGRVSVLPPLASVGEGDRMLALIRGGSPTTQEADRIVHEFATCPLLDLPQARTSEAFSSAAAEALAAPTGLSRDELLERIGRATRSSVASLTPWLTVVRVLLSEAGQFHALVARTPAFGTDGQLQAVFVLASSETESRVHLQALAVVARIVQQADFEERWQQATSLDELLELRRNGLKRPGSPMEYREVPDTDADSNDSRAAVRHRR